MNLNTAHFSHSSGMFDQQHFLAVLRDVFIIFPVFLIIFTWRGFIQAFVAKIVGDNTAQKEGFLTLNPLAHIDLYGFVIIMTIFFFVGGLFYHAIPRPILLMMLIIFGARWTVPVPLNEHRFKNYRMGGLITSLSGPIANFLLAFCSIAAMKLILQINLAPHIVVTIVGIFKTLIDIALFFGVLDLIPLPPFDGGRALRYILPYSAQPYLQWLEEYSLIILLILFIAPGINDIFFGGLFMLAMFIKNVMLSILF